MIKFLRRILKSYVLTGISTTVIKEKWIEVPSVPIMYSWKIISTIDKQRQLRPTVYFFKLLIIVVSTKCAAAGYITGKKRRVIWHRGENDQCNWQLQQVALTTYPRHSKFVPVKGSDCSHRIVFTSTNEFSLIYTVIFPLSLPAKYSQFNSNPRIYATAS